MDAEKFFKAVLDPTNHHDWRYEVFSLTQNCKETYIVSHNRYKKRYECSCPHWIFRLRKTNGSCKHIIFVKQFLSDTEWMLEDLK